MNAELVVGALLMLAPAASDRTADRFAVAIAHAAGDDMAAAAGLTVTVVREGGLDPDVETCRIAGQGGLGAFQLGPGWQHRCDAMPKQAETALRALRLRPWPDTFAAYLGSGPAYHEARARVALWTVTKERLECACCL